VNADDGDQKTRDERHGDGKLARTCRILLGSAAKQLAAKVAVSVDAAAR